MMSSIFHPVKTISECDRTGGLLPIQNFCGIQIWVKNFNWFSFFWNPVATDNLIANVIWLISIRFQTLIYIYHLMSWILSAPFSNSLCIRWILKYIFFFLKRPRTLIHCFLRSSFLYTKNLLFHWYLLSFHRKYTTTTITIWIFCFRWVGNCFNNTHKHTQKTIWNIHLLPEHALCRTSSTFYVNK